MVNNTYIFVVNEIVKLVNDVTQYLCYKSILLY